MGWDIEYLCYHGEVLYLHTCSSCLITINFENYEKTTYRVSPIVLAVVVDIEVPHIPLLRVTVKVYSVFSVRPVISHGLDVHDASQSADGVQLTALAISEGVSGMSHCKVITVQS